MTDFTRLIENEGFPLRASGIASNESGGAAKGTLRILHRYPARRPLGACRAAIISALLKDPANKEQRTVLREQVGSLLSKETGSTRDLINSRELINREVPWKILDPFAGGGSIPFEAMRLGCQVDSSDLNPVSWFVQMATMYYPSKIGLDVLPLPDIVNHGLDTPRDLSAHVGAWSDWLVRQVACDQKNKFGISENVTPIAHIWCRTFVCDNCRGNVPVFTGSVLQKRKGKVVAAVEPIIDREKKKIEWKVYCANSGDNLDSHTKIAFKNGRKITCPFCDFISITSKEISRDARENGMGHELIAVVETVDGIRKYRSPKKSDFKSVDYEDGEFAEMNLNQYGSLFSQPVPKMGQGASRAFSVGSYGMERWSDLFNQRQYWTVHCLINNVRKVTKKLIELNYPQIWVEAITAYLTCMVNLATERNTVISKWNPTDGSIKPTYETYSLPIRWSYAEGNPTSNSSGSIQNFSGTITKLVYSLIHSSAFTLTPQIRRKSVLDIKDKQEYDLIITDPPYYDQIPYSDTLDFFYMMIQAISSDLNSNYKEVFKNPLTPKWDSESGERELIDDSNRHGKDRDASKKAYEDGMFQAFCNLHEALKDEGRLIVVFAHKKPEAWETLVSALIRAGFQTTAAWPIRTESATKVSAGIRAFLSTSVWLVLKKRDPMADYEFDREIFSTIEERIKEKLRRFWDAGIRGPDFLWAALGPGLEVFSQYEFIRKFESQEGDELVSVGEFLDKVRDIVLRFSTGRLLSDYGSSENDAEQIDDMTRYYLLHRSWFAHTDVEAGELTKFAVACGFTDNQLAGRADIISSIRGKKRRLDASAEIIAADAQADADKRGGSKYRLNRWKERTPPKEGSAFENEDRPPALIDHVHRLLHLRMEGDKKAMDQHIKHWALGGHPVMPALVQALQEICKEENDKSKEELSLLESLSKDLERLAGVKPAKEPTLMDWMNEEED